MMASWKVVVCSLYLVHLAAYGLTKTSVLSPPTIIQQPPTEVTFKEEENVKLLCIAIGGPDPSYTWKKDDQPLTINNVYIKQLHGVGTIVINQPNGSYEGVYQCIASNNFGSALSDKTILKKAVLEPFPSVNESKMLRPFVGTPLTLLCHPPFSYPKAVVYWAESKGHRLRPIDNCDRISLDYEGNLYFANVLAEDSRGGVDYICIAQNMDLRSLVQDGGVKVDPQPISGSPKHEPPRLVWPISGTNEVALRGQSTKLKCIFSGYPTPTVNWTRLDTALPWKVIINSFGQEITIPDTDYEDVGSYRCTGTNSHSQTSRTVALRVESPPYWRHEKPPEDVNTADAEHARFECVTNGQPRPQIAWFINGIPVQELPPEPRRIIGRDYIDFLNVTKADVQVIQCNASNIHGYIFANAFLNVLAEPPSFIETPQNVVKVAERQNATLTRQVFGAPKPVITWKRSDIGSTAPSEPVSGDRFVLENSGNLRILNVKTEDQGTYHCEANNKFGKDNASGNLLVRNRTTITEAPMSQTVNASMDVILHCNAKTDADEKRKLKIDWLKNNRKIDYEQEGSISKNVQSNTLKITQAQVSDSGNYTCNASNGLDFDFVSVKLTVIDRTTITEAPMSQAEVSESGNYASNASNGLDSDIASVKLLMILMCSFHMPRMANYFIWQIQNYL